MKRKINHLIALFKKASRKQVIIVGAIALGLVGYFFFLGGSAPVNEFVKVERGSVKQEIRVTGATKPLDSVNLGFEQSGRIVEANSRVGDRVFPGQVLARLDQGTLMAQRAEQAASVDSEMAQLQEMQKGSRPEDIRIKEAALAKANEDLDSEYRGVIDALNDAYIKTEDAIRKQLDDIFSNDEQTNPQLTFSTINSQLRSSLEKDRMTASLYLNTWKKEIEGLSITSNDAALDTAMTSASTKLSFFRDFLGNLTTAVNNNIGLSSSQIDTYKTNITTARTNVNAALTDINSTVQTISGQKLSVKQSEADLNRTLAGNTPESVASQAARVKQAEARVQATDAQIQKTILRAPFSGVVTRQDAKTGEISTPNTPLISIISEGKLEVEANIPEADIGKVTIGNPTVMTIDAFPGETFPGKVRYIDPAETIIDGVTNFKTKIIFDTIDLRLKSGLTTNLVIKTLEKENVLTLPQYALIEDNKKFFVERQEGENLVRVPVTIGIRGTDGKIEILSGLNEGDMVISSGVQKSN